VCKNKKKKLKKNLCKIAQSSDFPAHQIVLGIRKKLVKENSSKIGHTFTATLHCVSY
jgi:hypothetical protein